VEVHRVETLRIPIRDLTAAAKGSMKCFPGDVQPLPRTSPLHVTC
jgi:hypothetical protein